MLSALSARALRTKIAKWSLGLSHKTKENVYKFWNIFNKTYDLANERTRMNKKNTKEYEI